MAKDLRTVLDDGELDELEEISESGDYSALWEATRNGDLDSLREIIERRNIQGAILDRLGLLHYIAEQKELSEEKLLAIVNYFLERGANIEYVDGSQKTPLEYAVMENNTAAVKLLLDKGADIEYVNKFEKTVLMHAAQWCDPEILKLLLDRGAKIRHEHVDLSGERVVFRAISSNNPQLLEILIDRGADIKLMHILKIIDEGYIAMLELLSDRGVDIHSNNSPGIFPTTLFDAVYSYRVEMVKLLIRKGGKVDQYDQAGQSLVEFTINQLIFHQDVVTQKPIFSEMAKLLISSGASTFKEGRDLLADFPELINYRAALYGKVRSILKDLLHLETVFDDYVRSILQAAPKAYAWRSRHLETLMHLEKITEIALPKDLSSFYGEGRKIHALIFQLTKLKSGQFNSEKKAQALTEEDVQKEKEKLQIEINFFEKFLKLPNELGLNFLLKAFWSDFRDDYLIPYLASILPEECKPSLSQWVHLLITPPAEGDKPNALEAWFNDGCPVEIDAPQVALETEEEPPHASTLGFTH